MFNVLKNIIDFKKYTYVDQYIKAHPKLDKDTQDFLNANFSTPDSDKTINLLIKEFEGKQNKTKTIVQEINIYKHPHCTSYDIDYKDTLCQYGPNYVYNNSFLIAKILANYYNYVFAINNANVVAYEYWVLRYPPYTYKVMAASLCETERQNVKNTMKKDLLTLYQEISKDRSKKANFGSGMGPVM